MKANELADYLTDWGGLTLAHDPRHCDVEEVCDTIRIAGEEGKEVVIHVVEDEVVIRRQGKDGHLVQGLNGGTQRQAFRAMAEIIKWLL